MDTLACNYDSTAWINDVCLFDVGCGCGNPAAAPGFDCFGNCLSGLDAVTLTLTDSYGDTWNGGTLTVDGVVYDQPTPYSGSGWSGAASDVYTVCLDLSGCIDLIMLQVHMLVRIALLSLMLQELY
jgi:hypothetical protein